MFRFAVFALAAVAYLPASAQTAPTGVIAGTVTDAATNRPLESAQVQIESLNVGAVSRPSGRYLLLSIPEGSHELRVEMLGYATVTRAVKLAAGDTVTVDVRMNATTLQLEEIVVTGTAFEESPVTLPYAVSVAGRRTLAEQGSPQATDFFKHMGASHGTLGEVQSWFSHKQTASVPETVANVNLRALGASRTLVLLNGRRQVYVPARLFGGRFVDVNAFPAVALDRIEVLKEGASAVYGSDAVAGVVNFLTRKDFSGFEATASHDYFPASGTTTAGAIWGRSVGENAHAVLSGEVVVSQVLQSRDRDWALRPFTAGAGAWSYTGNPGAFLFPQLTGSETKDEFVEALIEAHGGGGVLVDPQCSGFGGHVEPATCRFRYQPWDDLQSPMRHLRAFGEVNGERNDGRTSWHAEGLVAQAVMPEWVTTPSFPPVSPYTDAQIITAGNPGRQQFCGTYARAAGFASSSACLENDWYFFGRLVGNSGTGRTLERASSTQRIAASAAHEFGELAGEAMTIELAGSYSRSGGNVRLPAEYVYRRYLAFRGFGGSGCGVGVVVDPSTPAGMKLGPLNGAVAGQGNCMYFNPFSNAHQYSRQPGATYEKQPNPDYLPGLENSPELIDWINEVTDLEGTAGLVVADATLKGTLAPDLASFAVGYQFRRLDVSAIPNEPADLNVNPCPVLGDDSCPEKAGPFVFSNGYYPYNDAQNVHRVYVELPVTVGERFSLQGAANYEFHNLASSFDPRLAMRVKLTDALAARVSVQTTFRTPSVDDVNEDFITSSNYVSEAGAYKALDTRGNPELRPEQAFTFNAGVSLDLPRLRASLDYWHYSFEDMIELVPYASLTRLYDEGGASRLAVQEFISCPDGRGTGTCDARSIERVQVNLTNWPGVETTGVDWHASTRFPLGDEVIALGTDGTYTHRYNVLALLHKGSEMYPAQEAAGRLNWLSPIAPPLPRWKARFSAGVHWRDFSVVNYVNTVSSYINDAFEGTSGDPELVTVDRWPTWDASILRRVSAGWDAALSVVNVLGSDPPYVAWEQSYDGFTHSARGRRIKLSLTWKTARGS